MNRQKCVRLRVVFPSEKKRLEAERDAALKQASAVSREYDRLMEEHADVQAKLKKAECSESSKKDD